MGNIFSSIWTSFQTESPSVKGENSSSSRKFVVNFILQRHGTSCANVIKKGRLKGAGSTVKKVTDQITVSRYVPDPSLSNIGVQQCLAASDFFKRCDELNVKYITSDTTAQIPIRGTVQTGGTVQNSTNQTTPELLFCCSELTRSQQTVFLSFIKYMDAYLKTGKKILILPWLNEERSFTGLNKDNRIISLTETKSKWKEFIEALFDPKSSFSEDIGQSTRSAGIVNMSKTNKKSTEKSPVGEANIPESPVGKCFKDYFPTRDNLKWYLSKWDNIFELRTDIYGNKPTNKFGSTDFRPADYKKIMSVLYGVLSTTVNIVMTGHRKSMTKIIRQIDENNELNLVNAEMINGEVIKLPPLTLESGEIQTKLTLESGEIQTKLTFDKNSTYRLFPIGFNRVIIKCVLRSIFHKFSNAVKNNNKSAINTQLSNAKKNKWLQNDGYPLMVMLKNSNHPKMTPEELKQNIEEKINKLMTNPDIYPYYIFYISKLGIFISFPYIITQKFEFDVKKMKSFFDQTFEEYSVYLKNLEKLYEKINKFYDKPQTESQGKNQNTNKGKKQNKKEDEYFYNYGFLYRKLIDFNKTSNTLNVWRNNQTSNMTIGKIIQCNVLNTPLHHPYLPLEQIMANYLFEFCGCKDKQSICQKVQVMKNVECSKK